MWLQLFSFQNILTNQFQQRPWPLVVWVQEEEEEEEKEEEEEEDEGEHACVLCPWRALWVYECE